MQKTTRVLAGFLAIVCVALSFSPTAFAQGWSWSGSSGSNNPICTAPNDQINHAITDDGSGGMILVWEDYRSGSVSDLYAQRIDSNGQVRWTPANGVPVCTAANNQNIPEIIGDGAGGAIIVWADARGADVDIYAQRIDANGNLLWPSTGIAICTAAMNQSNPHLVSDGAGGAIIAWQDPRFSPTMNDIYVQRVSGGGVVQWAGNGIAICTATNNQVSPEVVSDGGTGAIIVWQDGRSGSNNDIYAYKISATGGNVWGVADGKPVTTATLDQINPSAVPNGFGGVIVAWEDSRAGTGLWDIYAQRIDPLGNVLASDVAICTATGIQRDAEIVPDGSGGAIITWHDERTLGTTGVDIYAQRIDGTSTPQWAGNGVAVCTSSQNQDSPTIAADGSGGAIIAWRDFRGISADIYAQRINSFGSPYWAVDGIVVASATLEQRNPEIFCNFAGEPIIAWEDTRVSSTNSDIYAQKILSNGSFPQTPALGSGIYTVDSGAGSFDSVPTPNNGVADWSNLMAATDYLYTHGISGPVMIEVKNGTGPYPGTVKIKNINRFGATTDGISVQNAAGHTPVITGGSFDGIRMEFANFINIQGLTFTSFGIAGISIDKGCSNCSIDSNVFNITGVSGQWGIYVRGSTHMIRNNTISASGAEYLQAGILLESTFNCAVETNTITGNIIGDGIVVLGPGANSQVIRRNSIILSPTTGSSLNGIRLDSPATNIRVENNMISLISNGVGPAAGIAFVNTGANTEIYHNSIRVRHNSSYNACGVYFNTSAGGHIFANNIYAVERTLGSAYCFYRSGPGSILSDYNNFDRITDDTSTFAVHDGSTDYLLLFSFQLATGYDINSHDFRTVFFSTSNLHLPLTSPLNRLGTPISGLTNDFDNDLRDATNPDIGADEFAAAGPGAPVNLFAVPSSQQINVTWDPMTGIAGYLVYYGTSPGLYYEPGSPVFTTTNGYTLTGLMNGVTYYITVTAFNTDGVEGPAASEISATPVGPSVSYTHTRDLIGGTTPDVYRMISFPVIPSDSDPLVNLEDNLGPYDPAIWRLFVYDFSTGQYFEIYYPYSGISITPGMAFWIISLNNVTIDVSGTLVDPTRDFTITLQPGWNMIGHPFNFNVNWADVTANGIPIGAPGDNGYVDETLWDWLGYYTVSDQLVPGRGYWVHNPTGSSVTLVIPPLSTTAGSIGASAKAKSKSTTRGTSLRSSSRANQPPSPPGAIRSSGGGGGGGGGGCYVASATSGGSDVHLLYPIAPFLLIFLILGTRMVRRPRLAWPRRRFR